MPFGVPINRESPSVVKEEVDNDGEAQTSTQMDVKPKLEVVGVFNYISHVPARIRIHTTFIHGH